MIVLRVLGRVFTNDNRSLIFEFHCNPDETKWWREWLVLKFFPDLKAKIGAFKVPRILQMSTIKEVHTLKNW